MFFVHNLYCKASWLNDDCVCMHWARIRISNRCAAPCILFGCLMAVLHLTYTRLAAPMYMTLHAVHRVLHSVTTVNYMISRARTRHGFVYAKLSILSYKLIHLESYMCRSASILGELGSRSSRFRAGGSWVTQGGSWGFEILLLIKTRWKVVISPSLPQKRIICASI